MSINFSERNANDYLQKVISKDCLPNITVACINSPQNVTLSGDKTLIEDIKERLELADKYAHKLNTGVAYHSHQMQEIASQYQSAI